MNRIRIWGCCILLVLLVAAVHVGLASPRELFMSALSSDTVTFQVNMKVQMLKGNFLPGSGDVVTVPGDINGWSTSSDTLTDPDGDSVYTTTKVLGAEGTIHYKFFKTLRAGLDYEHDQPTVSHNREYDVVVGTQTIPMVWFNDDSVYSPPPPNVPVTFQVNMRVKMAEGTFLPDSGDIVRVAGGFNGWGSSTDTLTDPDHDSIYTKTLQLGEGTAIQYKFLKTLRGGLDWENSLPANRAYTVPVGGGTLPVVYFDGDSLVSLATSGNILWQVQMEPYITLGWFLPDKDSMQLRGPMNGWNGTAMEPNVFDPDIYELLLPYSGFTYDEIQHKFYMKMDSVSAEARFPGFGGFKDDVQYEHPSERGDANRSFNIGTGGDVATPLAFFSGINSQGLLTATDTVNVTLQVNMGPATRSIIPFNPAADTVYLLWHDQLSRLAQVKIQGTFPNTLRMSLNGVGDSVYSVTFKIIGPAHYNLMYRYRIVQAGGGVIDISGGLGGSDLYYSRFIQPITAAASHKTAATTTKSSPKGKAIASTSWPKNYSTPIDNWQDAAPLPSEVPPFDIVSSVSKEPTVGKPLTYKLQQNYPNPFNPQTRINYSIPEHAHVSLKVYNLIGQEVATIVNQDQFPGNYVAVFEANRFPSGVYFYRLEAGSFRQVMKMVLMK